MFPAFAQTADIWVSGWGSLTAAIANIGFSAAVAIYLLTKALPSMQQSFVDALVSHRREYLEDIKNSRKEYFDAGRDSRLEHKDSLTAVITHCEREGQRRDDVMKSEISESTAVIIDNRRVLEEVRDALRDMRETLKEVQVSLKEIKR